MHNPVTFKGWAFERAVCETQEHAGSSLPLPRLLPPFLFFYVPSPFFLPARSLARSRYIYTRRGRICAARKSFDRVDRAILPDSRKYATTLWRNLCISTTCVSVRVCVCVEITITIRSIKGSNEKERKGPLSMLDLPADTLEILLLLSIGPR